MFLGHNIDQIDRNYKIKMMNNFEKKIMQANHVQEKFEISTNMFWRNVTKKDLKKTEFVHFSSFILDIFLGVMILTRLKDKSKKETNKTKIWTCARAHRKKKYKYYFWQTVRVPFPLFYFIF